MTFLRPHCSEHFSIPITSKWFQNRHGFMSSPLVQFTPPHLANMARPVRYDRDVAWGKYHCKVVLESRIIMLSGLRNVAANLSLEKRSPIMCKPTSRARVNWHMHCKCICTVFTVGVFSNKKGSLTSPHRPEYNFGFESGKFSEIFLSNYEDK